jgi:hypothetical protein
LFQALIDGLPTNEAYSAQHAIGPERPLPCLIRYLIITSVACCLYYSRRSPRQHEWRQRKQYSWIDLRTLVACPPSLFTSAPHPAVVRLPRLSVVHHASFLSAPAIFHSTRPLASFHLSLDPFGFMCSFRRPTSLSIYISLNQCLRAELDIRNVTCRWLNPLFL